MIYTQTHTHMNLEPYSYYKKSSFVIFLSFNLEYTLGTQKRAVVLAVTEDKQTVLVRSSQPRDEVASNMSR